LNGSPPPVVVVVECTLDIVPIENTTNTWRYCSAKASQQLGMCSSKVELDALAIDPYDDKACLDSCFGDLLRLVFFAILVTTDLLNYFFV